MLLNLKSSSMASDKAAHAVLGMAEFKTKRYEEARVGIKSKTY